MKKLSIILDETTILNFPFLWLLVRRYKYISLITPFLGGLFALYLYFSQNLISTVSMGFKSVSNEANSPTNAISKVLGETKDVLTPQEIVGMASSLDFIQKVAEEVVKHPKFEELNLNSFDAKKILSVKEMFKDCKGDLSCETSELTKVLPLFISINQDKMVETKFYVDVKTLDFYTSHILVQIVSQTISNERVNSMKHGLSSQRLITTELLNKKNEEINSTNFVGLSNEMKTITAELEIATGRVASLGAIYESKKLDLSKMDITLKQTEKSFQSGTSDDERETYNQVETLKLKIKQVTQDIHSIELNKGTLSPGDQGILDQLKSELKEKKRELRHISKNDRSVANVDQFLEAKDKDSNFTSFDYKVAKQELAKLQMEYDLAKADKDRLFNHKMEIDQKLEQLRPAFEYLKLLETKKVQLELLESTVVSDFVFDQLPSGVTHFKRATKEKIALFSMLVTVFVMFAVLLFRYLLDSRIYNEMELKRNFEDIIIIGNTPDFN